MNSKQNIPVLIGIAFLTIVTALSVIFFGAAYDTKTGGKPLSDF